MAGLGGISGAWLAALTENPDWELVAACDPGPTARARLLESGRLPAAAIFTDLDAALAAAPDATVLMLIPPDQRFSAARNCLQRGHPLLTEKPMSLNLRHARILAETARRSGVPYAVNQNYRFCSFGRVVRKLLLEETVGPVAFAECSAHKLFSAHGYRARERDVMVFEMGVHYVDLLRYWFGCDLAAVQALAPEVPFSAHSSAAVFFALIEMEAGQSVAISASRESRGQSDPFEGRWRFCGPRGSIQINDFGQGPGVYIDCDPDKPPQLVAASAGMGEGFRRQLAEFARSLREGRPSETDCFDNLNTLAGCFAIADAYRLRRRVRTADLIRTATA